MNANIPKNFRIVIASVPNYENCVCEIYYGREQWVEILKEGSEVMIQFVPHSHKKNWEFPLDIALEILNQAKDRYLKGMPQTD